jgi:hypothetical protein
MRCTQHQRSVQTRCWRSPRLPRWSQSRSGRLRHGQVLRAKQRHKALQAARLRAGLLADRRINSQRMASLVHRGRHCNRLSMCAVFYLSPQHCCLALCSSANLCSYVPTSLLAMQQHAGLGQQPVAQGFQTAPNPTSHRPSKSSQQPQYVTSQPPYQRSQPAHQSGWAPPALSVPSQYVGQGSWHGSTQHAVQRLPVHDLELDDDDDDDDFAGFGTALQDHGERMRVTQQLTAPSHTGVLVCETALSNAWVRMCGAAHVLLRVTGVVHVQGR